MFGKLTHADTFQRRCHFLLDLFGRNAQILQSKSHILIHHRANDLIIRILEHHADRFTDRPDLIFCFGVDVIDPQRPFCWHKQRVQMFCKGRLTGSVSAQNAQKLALTDFHADVLQRILTLLFLRLRLFGFFFLLFGVELIGVIDHRIAV